jgi:hypothetical protein
VITFPVTWKKMHAAISCGLHQLPELNPCSDL